MIRFLFSLIGIAAGLGLLSAAEPDISSVSYWIDDNHADAVASTVTEFDIDCSQLAPGLHTLNYRVADSNGRFSALHQHSFLKVAPATKADSISSLQYWWDDLSANAVIAPYTADEFVLSTNALPYGLHSLNYRVKDSADRWSELRTHYFYKGEAQDSARIVSYSYWWNDLKDDVTRRELDEPATTFELDEDFRVPENARTNYAGHYTATLNVAFTDNHGRSNLISTNVVYPDNDPPSTDIDADRYIAESTVVISWEELTNDDMGDYNVYYSKDGGPWLLWLPDTQLTQATFKGERGCSYLFTVTGRDALGNREKYDESKCVSVTFE